MMRSILLSAVVLLYVVTGCGGNVAVPQDAGSPDTRNLAPGLDGVVGDLSSSPADGPGAADSLAQDHQVTATICNDTCALAKNGACNDDGPWSLTGGCPLGTDCHDCGPRSTGLCGNAVRDPGEGCDDSNSTPGDGCDGACQVEKGWSCTKGPAWSVPVTTPDLTPGAKVSNWTVSTTKGGAGLPLHETDEATCIGGFLKSPGWISPDMSGCGSVGSKGWRFFRGTFDVTQKQLNDGAVVMGLGFDNQLFEVEINGQSYPVAYPKMFSHHPGWPAPRWPLRLAKDTGLKVGKNELVLKVYELGEASTGNYSGVSVSVLQADSCSQ